jgi:hypothetical protein
MIDKTPDTATVSAGKRLLEHWRNSGDVTLKGSATPGQIAFFEDSNKIQLPQDFREYLRLMDGFDQDKNYQDARGFNFWPLTKLAPVARYDGHRYSFANDDSYFLFCDYLDFSWAYAVCLRPGKNDVVLVGTGNGVPKQVADSFTEFVDEYIRDDEALYP